MNVLIFSMESFSCAQDFAVTPNYAVFFDIQITANLWWILRGRPPMGADAAKVARLGIIPRYAEDERDMRWIEAPGLNVLHCVNAWEEDDDDAAAITMVVSNAAVVENTVERRQLSEKALDFAVINPAYAAKENRDPDNLTAAEDDGYLVTYVHDDNAQESMFLVMDAKSSTLDIVAAVKLPQRVPGAFHCLFLSELELRMASS
ncbi:hypothetical protein SASPL_133538 [Salvia splendens]|uniref:9-cis-epoxycarotenoid dioxygenase n=1 Tax=Salvia splendens TaxID=180675 RepID=A0A8X8ZJ77_SALSN|nr:hypothetical protein SASPL_133538 [Salvia splendens]